MYYIAADFGAGSGRVIVGKLENGEYVSLRDMRGMNKNIIINRFVSTMPQKFEIATGKGQFCGCIFTVDDKSGKCTEIERLYIEEK